MIAIQGAFFNYQHFRESLKQSPTPARVWNATAMGQTRDQLMETVVSTSWRLLPSKGWMAVN
ncbi:MULTISPECIES: hypothetical protein [unclassified Pseudomonas]|uniref:hypothetical protein n=1 Tax=unclassified Pseudomonas TaxID=196821 RepID=UPI002AC89F71|nr:MULTISPECIES: hypothetical protein [unclassified Pseudomonas]MEB0077277.1 hypothetical protein [Pseudomonas sp. MH10out]MEB0091392.1 hypothetical protein [Pseudomonas sp. CCI4.2]MEB0129260.1 hypothetical protein [Pseudomonas sp. CCI2.4]MEB0157489.1 hypothetical protein [Pseudomonas sp. AH2 (2023)]MEB0165552.1 hypothetical protein [Pseudomonas sp. CCC4.4]